MWITRSKGIARASWLEQILGSPVRLESGQAHVRPDHTTIHGRLEEGLLAYGRHPDFGHSALSIVLDRAGIHYDTARTSDLQRILKDIQGGWSEGMAVRARRIIGELQRLRLTKYNFQEGLLDRSRWRQYRLLIVDQAKESRALGFGGANQGIFEQMVDSAFKTFAETDIIIKLHPDHELHRGTSMLHGRVPPGVSIVPAGINIWSVFDHVDTVYTVSSQVGFEALLARKKVVCFAQPFYAGWGLTTDLASTHGEVKNLTLEQLVYGVLIKYSVYIHPERRERCEIEDILAYLESGLKKTIGFHKVVYTVGLNAEQKKVITPFLQGHFAQEVRHLAPRKGRHREFAADEATLFWEESGRRGDDLMSYLANRGVTVLRAGSWTMPLMAGGPGHPLALHISKYRLHDQEGLGNDLTLLLENGDFSPQLLRRAETLHQRLLTVMDQRAVAMSDSVLKSIGRRPVALVFGHLDADGALGAGENSVRSDQELLNRVRRNFPEAYIIYAPQFADFRGRRQTVLIETALCDYVARPEQSVSCLKLADTVHVISSLSGVHALMCGKMVYTYGRPFYAGWGLTRDSEVFEERNKHCSLTELLSVAWILGPTYFDWQTKTIGTPEEIVRRLMLVHSQGGHPSHADGPSRHLNFYSLCYPKYLAKIRTLYSDLLNDRKWKKNG